MKSVRFVKTDDISAKINTLFESEKRKLSVLLPNAQIEHIGATAVPGTISKGDLDINIRVNLEAFPKATEILKASYEINQQENWSDGFASFKDDKRDLGIQLTLIDGPEDYFVAQRDYLLNHPESVSELNALKRRFEGKNMDEYRKAKGDFFDNLRKNTL